jgi:3-polyprenyl-4-hydroxybenzoate decarboxylase
VFCPGCLVVSAGAYAEDGRRAESLAQWKDFAGWQLIVLADDTSIAASASDFLWSVFTRFEPAADIYAAQTEVRRHHLCYSSPIVIDARMKPSYPEELVCDAETAQKVDARWQAYFPRGT